MKNLNYFELRIKENYIEKNIDKDMNWEMGIAGLIFVGIPFFASSVVNLGGYSFLFIPFFFLFFYLISFISNFILIKKSYRLKNKESLKQLFEITNEDLQEIRQSYLYRNKEYLNYINKIIDTNLSIYNKANSTNHYQSYVKFCFNSILSLTENKNIISIVSDDPNVLSLITKTYKKCVSHLERELR